MRLKRLSKKIMSILLILSFLAGPLNFFTVQAEEESCSIEIKMPGQVRTGSRFTGEMLISNVHDLSAVQYDLVFDDTELEVIRVSAGQIGEEALPVTDWKMVSAGRIRILQETSGENGLSGSGCLSKVLFRAGEEAVSQVRIDLDKIVLSNSLAEQITATWISDKVEIITWESSLAIATNYLPSTPVDVPYQEFLVGEGGAPPYQWDMIGGELPEGLELNRDSGEIAGIAREEGSFTFALRLTDNVGSSVYKEMGMVTGVSLFTDIQVADLMRPDRTYPLTIYYGNEGDFELKASLFRLTSPTNAPLRSSSDESYEVGDRYYLGIGKKDPADILVSGYNNKIELQTRGTHTFTMDFELNEIIPDNTALDWNEILNNRPEYYDSDGWPAVVENLQEQVGETTAEMIAVLRQDAAYLSREGIFVQDVGELMSMEVAEALATGFTPELEQSTDVFYSAPGPDLEFTRYYPQALDRRYHLGFLGRGWLHSYDIYLAKDKDNNIIITAPAYRSIFTREDDGSYQPPDGDYSRLEKVSGGYELSDRSSTSWYFNNDGRLTGIGDKNGNRLDLSYAGNQLKRVQHTSGQYIEFTYNAAGRMTGLTDHAGRITTFRYDSTGTLLAEVKQPGSWINKYEYITEASSRARYSLNKIVYADGRERHLVYDGKGRVTADHPGDESQGTIYEYPRTGKIIVTEQPDEPITFYFNQDRAVVRIVNAEGETAYYSYDNKGRLVECEGPDSLTVSLGYDTSGNLTVVKDTGDHSTYFSYYGNNLPASLEDAKGNVTGYQYSDKGNLEQVKLPDDCSYSLSHDTRGLITRAANCRGQEIEYQYDELGRVTREDYPDETWIEYDYNDSGRLTAARNSSGTIELQYNERELLTRVNYPSGNFLKYGYDELGRCESRVDQTGFALNYDYDGQGRLESIKDSKMSLIVAYEYDQAGRITRETKGNGLDTIYDYNELGQLDSLVNYKPSGEVLSGFNYSYDKYNRCTDVVTSAGTIKYHYDNEGQLTGVSYPDGNQETYSYDAVGNRITAEADGSKKRYITNPRNQYTAAGGSSFSYDPDGNLVAEIARGINTTYQYDAMNRLVGVQSPDDTWEYCYDVLGNRSSVIHNGEERRFTCEPSGMVDADVVTEYDSEGTVMARYIYGRGLAAMINDKGSCLYYAFDGSGNTQQIVDSNLNILNSYEYTPFGLFNNKNELVRNPFQFSGRWGVMAEEGQELYWMRNRYYDPARGRFLTEDPIGLLGGDENLYSYCHNDPINYIDPLGTRWGENEETMGFGRGRKVDFTPKTKEEAVFQKVVGGGLLAMILAPVVAYFGPAVVAKGKVLATNVGGATITTLVNHPEIPEKMMSYIESYYGPGAPNFNWSGLAGWGSSQLGLHEYVLSRIYGEKRNSTSSLAIRSWDPNEKEGPEGDVVAGSTISYKILFENDPEGYPKTDNLQATAVELKVQINEEGKAYYVVLAPDAAAPDSEQVKAGHDGMDEEAEIKGMMDVAAYTDITAEIEGLLPRTEYKIYVVAEDESCNLTDVQVLDIETPAETESGTFSTLSAGDGAESGDETVMTACYSGFTAQSESGEDNEPPVFPIGSTAPVQELRVVDNLHPALDWSSFRPTGYGFGDNVYLLDGEEGHYSGRVNISDYRNDIDKEWWVDVSIDINLINGQIVWKLTTLDPDTGALPLDALAGFLPVNDKDLANGEGYLTYDVKVRDDAAAGINITNQAEIFFDYNPGIFTPKVSNMVIEPSEPVIEVPQIALSTERLDFGTLEVGETAGKILTVYNSGSSTLQVSEFTGPFTPFVLEGGENLTEAIPPGASVELQLSFAPVVKGDFLSILTINSNAEEDAATQIELLGSAVPVPAPAIMAVPCELVFADTVKGNSLEQSIAIYNNGNADLKISQAGFESPGSGAFSLPGIDESEINVAPGKSISLKVRFTPPEAPEPYEYNDTLLLETNDPEYGLLEITVAGSGILPAPDIALSRESILFGLIKAGDTVERSFTVMNKGESPLNITGITINSDPAGSNFGLVNASQADGLEVPGGATENIAVFFNPSSADQYEGSISIASDDPDEGEVKVALSGAGQEAILVQNIQVFASDGKTKIVVGDTVQIQAEVLPAEAENKTVNWSVEFQEAATIDQQGLLNARQLGSTVVTATAADGSGITGTLEIIVIEDRAELEAGIQSAQELYNSSVEGEEPGQYVPGSREELYNAISAARSTAENDTATQQELDDALAVLNQAVEDFEAGQVKDECFIATAAYGSKFTPEVTVLRDFRDQYLMNSLLGKSIVEFYYRHSPPLAEYIAKKPAIKTAVRLMLLPVAGFAYLLLHYQAFIMLLMLVLALVILRSRKGEKILS